MAAVITLVLGGARSGKSEVAEGVARRVGGRVAYFATADLSEPGMRERAERHRGRRPAEWETREVDTPSELPRALAAHEGTALVDSLGVWLARLPGFAADPGVLCGALEGRSGDSVLVSDEVGLGVHPSTAAGMEFRDRLGELNRRVASVADEVILVVAGRPLALGPAPGGTGPRAGR
jgi:adenosylcobinamide kinase/adenosylcobinamide-phosphate guanylyltransferase